MKKRNLNGTQTHKIPKWIWDSLRRLSVQRKWLVELGLCFLHPLSKMKAIKRNQSVKRGEGVMKSLWRNSFWLLPCDLPEILSVWKGQKYGRIAYRQKRAGLRLIKSYPKKTSCESKETPVPEAWAKMDPSVCWCLPIHDSLGLGGGGGGWLASRAGKPWFL